MSVGRGWGGRGRGSSCGGCIACAARAPLGRGWVSGCVVATEEGTVARSARRWPVAGARAAACIGLASVWVCSGVCACACV